MNVLLGIAVIVVLLAIAIYLESWQKKKTVEAAFSGRTPLESEQFYDRYFKEKGVPFHIVAGIRAVLEEQLSADMSRLADTDDFSKNLNFFWDFDSMADVEIVCALEERFGIKISDNEAEKTHTVSDIVNLVCNKARAQRAA